MSKNKYDSRNGAQGQAPWSRRRADGYGMNLYRNVKKRKIAGVCAGVADHLNVDRWVPRGLFIAGVFFISPPVMVMVYIACWVLLAPRPKFGKARPQRYRYDESAHEDRPVNMLQSQPSASERLQTARTRMEDAVKRTAEMERYVTSRRYQLDKEFSKIR
ncbi:PspC domain-containing protein [Reinekea marinisedimentorum]|uniref:Phage shock protein C n=1 Tax=Reinekea marinisedimentorum TaxID=230495 RepID=A0A4R3IFP9_9GAMM|nr:PspC domain-containing protein [Reinekea marinisedimentorum]TCS43812.1 phage shock protein C [Reinekea marinisedimentorum]